MERTGTAVKSSESKRRRRGGAPEIFAIPDGDIFRLGKLLELAGLDLDKNFNTAGEPLRERGTVVDVEVFYNNLHHFTSSFGDQSVGYIYRVVERPMNEMKTEVYAKRQPLDFPKTRWIENRHGILLRVSVQGTFGHFNIVYLLVMMTTSLALMAAVTKGVDLMAIYVMHRHQEYYDYKYDQTEIKAAERLF